MQTVVDVNNWPAIIAAIGSIITSCLTLLLVYKGKERERETRQHRQEETKVAGEIAKRLGVDVTELAKQPKSES